MQYGQFIAFIAPTFLEDDAEKQKWRVDGAHAMSRAVDLGANADRAISAATILSKSGEREAAIKSLRRAYAVTDSPSERDDIAQKLAILEATAERDDAARDVQFVESRWRKDFPFLSRGEFLLIGPPVDPLRCAGRGGSGGSGGASRNCASDWSSRIPSQSLDPD
jgi:hypothetical protein